MRKLLTATTALALVGGAAFAEIDISGSAEAVMDYNSEPGEGKSKHSFNHDFNVNFAGSGTTDGGLSFGASGGFDNESGGGESLGVGTVFVSGAFGKITFGDNDAADKLSGGIADVGLNDVGVDDVVEDIYGTTAAQIRYDHSLGNISLAISAGTDVANEIAGPTRFIDAVNAASDGSAPYVAGMVEGDQEFEVKSNSYAIGMSFNASGATVGIGYDSKKTISAGFGYSTGQISASAFYAKGDLDYMHLGADRAIGGDDNNADMRATAGKTGIGMDVSYTMGASTITLAYAKTDVSNIQPVWVNTDGDVSELATATASFGSASFTGIGIGFSHDLGGGAKLVAGFGEVPATAVADLTPAQLGQQPNTGATGSIEVADYRMDLGKSINKASIGLSFSF